MVYSYVIGGGRRRISLFRLSMLGIGETIFDQSDWAEKVLDEVRAEPLHRCSQSLIKSMLTIRRDDKKKKRKLIVI